MYQNLTKCLEENYTNACLGWQMNIGGKKVEEGRRYVYRGWHGLSEGSRETDSSIFLYLKNQTNKAGFS